MQSQTQLPWASGPAEILRHGLSLLKGDSDTNRRLAMISIDNAVELMTKTYLGLPKRITNLEISRREFTEISESFPALLDALERYAPEKLTGIDLGTIEWYHRLRNQLYHQGNGLTVERDKVEIYAELANLLFQNLFGIPLVSKATTTSELLGDFIQLWVDLERSLTALVARGKKPDPDSDRPRPVLETMRLLQKGNLFSSAEIAELNALRTLRNEVMHGTHSDFHTLVTRDTINRLRKIVARLKQVEKDSDGTAKTDGSQ